MARVITISSLKGGVGKTTLAVFLARAFAGVGVSVLTVDLDHNNNLTDYWLRASPPDEIEARNVYHALTRSAAYEQVIWQGDTVSPVGVIPATPSLSRLGVELSRDQGAAMRLRAGLRKLPYDVVIIDTPPSLSLELTLGLYAADLVLVPVSAARWTVQGYQIIAEEVASVGESLGRSPEVQAVPSMVSETEAVSIREAGIWKAAEGGIYKDSCIRAAASEGRALRAGTRAHSWFDGLMREVAI